MRSERKKLGEDKDAEIRSERERGTKVLIQCKAERKIKNMEIRQIDKKIVGN